MFLQFVPKTHLFFTAGKDKKIKQWDADKFQLIQTLEVTFDPPPGFHSLICRNVDVVVNQKECPLELGAQYRASKISRMIV